jgi:hypothetical protein
MGGKSSTISTSAPLLGTLRVQTSMYGVAVRRAWGQVRIPGNLLDFLDFKQVAVTSSTSQGSKGGGGVTQVDTRYEYYASAIMALGGFTALSIVSAWKDKRRYSGEVIPITYRTLSYEVLVPSNGLVQAPVGAGGTFNSDVGVTIYSATSYERGGGN